MALTVCSSRLLLRSSSSAFPISAVSQSRSFPLLSGSHRTLSSPVSESPTSLLVSRSLSSVGICRGDLSSTSVHHVRHSYIPLRRTPASASATSPRRFTTRSIVAMAGSNEEAAAKAASAAADSGNPTIFDKIVRKEIPANIVYEDDEVMAFRDISPQAPVHIILIPKNRDGLTQLCKAEERHAAILGKLLLAARKVAINEGLVPNGYRIVINDGPDGCQSVYHLHIHILGGRQMKWPPG
ncbi:unnamed protein product [Closterium sp. NIES-65]|nr:unnamed protein product [Closterium sp. NIES-65]